ncbi:MAG: hypothetical protein ACQEQS_09800 [Thermodesulfobacteriota bacterium]
MKTNISGYRFLFFILAAIGIVSGASKHLNSAGDIFIKKYKIYKTRNELEYIKSELEKRYTENKTDLPSHRFTHWYTQNLSQKLSFEFPLDRWGEPVEYKKNNKKPGFILTSSGPDMKKGTDDDIVISSNN